MARNRKAHARARRSAAARRSQTEHRSHRLARTLHCEHLEDRRLLAVVTVDTVDDSIDLGDGKTSLREAIFATNTVSGADEIRFDFGHDGPATILLTRGELAITDSLTITGPGADLLTIDASGSDPTPQQDNDDGSRVFFIPENASAETTLAIAGLKLTGGDRALDPGGAIYAQSPAHLVRLVDCVLVDNAAFLGGAVFANRLQIERSRFEGNRANSGGAIIGGDMHVVDSRFVKNTSETDGGAISYGGAAHIVGSEFVANFAGDGGGAISAYGDLRIERSVLRDNEAVLRGGAVKHGTGILSVFATQIENNLASQLPSPIRGPGSISGGAGGGVYALGSEHIEIIDSTILNNRANGAGGGVNILQGGNILIDRSTVVGNDATYEGGGLLIAAGRAEIRQSTLANNESQGRGGGLYTSSNGEVAILETEIRGNTAAELGGGVFASGGTITIDRSTLSGNSAAGAGGGLYLVFSIHAIVRQSTISGNQAAYGGGIMTESFSRLDLLHSTVAANTASVVGGGLVFGRSTNLNHSILAGNASPEGPDLRHNNARSEITARWSVIGNRDGVPLAEAPVGSPDSSGNLIGGPVHGVIDALLAPLADNGGPTLTHSLLPGSPAIGAGDPALIPGIGGVPEFDQRGAPFTRVAGARIDIGAFELQSPGGALSADFDLDGLVDGSDFLVWQRNLGKTSGATVRHGDATADGDVDGNDLAVWRAKFGAGGGGAASVQSTTVSGAGQGTSVLTLTSEQLAGAAQQLARSALSSTTTPSSSPRLTSTPLVRRPYEPAQTIAAAASWRPAARNVMKDLNNADKTADTDADDLNFAAAVDELLGRE